MRQLRVANLSFSQSWGGLEMSTVKMARLFAEAGHQSYLICKPDTPIAKSGKDFSLQKGLSLQVHAFDGGKYFSPRTTLQLRRHFMTHQLDALYLHSLRDLWLVRPALIGIPHLKLFGFARMFLRGISKKDFLHQWLYGRVDRMISLSLIQRDLLIECLPVPSERFINIPNGVDIDRFHPKDASDRFRNIRQQWGIDDNHFLFGLIGRLDRQKGSLEFVEAAASVADQFPSARFVLVGGNTLGEEAFDHLIKTRISALGLKDKIILTDFRTDIPDVMNALDAFVMPSYEENFANVLLEALASGLPIIGTNSGGTPEILASGEAGLLCEPRSSKSLAANMLRLLSAPETGQSLGINARKRAESVYDIKHVFSQIEALALG